MAEERDLPEFYVDQFRVTAGVYGVAFTFGLAEAHPSPGQARVQDLARLRMSLEHAKIMVMIVKRQLKNWEQETGVQINIPRQVLNGLSLSSEDW